jgi:hypothetical protein
LRQARGLIKNFWDRQWSLGVSERTHNVAAPSRKPLVDFAQFGGHMVRDIGCSNRV